MSTSSDAFWRDANRVPILGNGLVASKTLTFIGDATTVATPIFTITGVVELQKLWGVVLVALGVNHTDAHWRINDQTATDVVLTKSTTLDLSAISAGAAIFKHGLAAAVAKYVTSDAAQSIEPTTLETQMFTPCVISQKTGGIQTDIEYVYTTTDEPTSGSIQFFAGYLPLSADASLAAA